MGLCRTAGRQRDGDATALAPAWRRASERIMQVESTGCPNRLAFPLVMSVRRLVSPPMSFARGNDATRRLYLQRSKSRRRLYTESDIDRLLLLKQAIPTGPSHLNGRRSGNVGAHRSDPRRAKASTCVAGIVRTAHRLRLSGSHPCLHAGRRGAWTAWH